MESECEATRLRRLQTQEAKRREQEDTAAAQAQQQQAQQRAARAKALKGALAITGIGALVLWLLDDKTKTRGAAPQPEQAHENRDAQKERQRECIIAALRNNVLASRRRSLTVEEFQEFCARWHADDYFPFLDDLIEDADILIVNRDDDEELIDDLRQVAEELGAETITPAEYEQYGGVLLSDIEAHFGSFEEALEVAGLEPRMTLEDIEQEEIECAETEREEREESYQAFEQAQTRVAILDDINRVAQKLSLRFPLYLTTEAYDTHGYLARSSVLEQFGSWADAINAAEEYRKNHVVPPELT